jgi:hypothetical protein
MVLRNVSWSLYNAMHNPELVVYLTGSSDNEADGALVEQLYLSRPPFLLLWVPDKMLAICELNVAVNQAADFSVSYLWRMRVGSQARHTSYEVVIDTPVTDLLCSPDSIATAVNDEVSVFPLSEEDRFNLLLQFAPTGIA